MSLSILLPAAANVANLPTESLHIPNRVQKRRNLLGGLESLNIQFVFDEKSAQFTFKLCQALKRVGDIAAASLGILVLLPFLVLLALAVKTTSPGPIIYRSLRIGKGKQPFSMYKFRTMVVNADKQWEMLRQKNGLDNELFKITNDPRMTPIGEFLRKYSLDEFPQLFNVIRGEMSLVGPRPYVPAESEMFEHPYTVRFAVQPGVTGLWQSSGRSNLTFQELSEMDLYYAVNWSLWQDLAILLKTVPAVLLRRGAY